jgi:hypothetical protein
VPGPTGARYSFAYRTRVRVANCASQIAIYSGAVEMFLEAMFLETGEPQVPRPGHLFAHLETAERTPSRVTSLIGTFATCRAHLEAELDLC